MHLNTTPLTKHNFYKKNGFWKPRLVHGGPQPDEDHNFDPKHARSSDDVAKEE